MKDVYGEIESPVLALLTGDGSWEAVAIPDLGNRDERGPTRLDFFKYKAAREELRIRRIPLADLVQFHLDKPTP